MTRILKKILRLLEESPSQVFLSFAAILLGIGALLHILGLTFLPLDQLYCRNYLPWNTLNFATPCSIYRSGDDILENDVSARELNYLKDNPYQNAFSERLMNGAPVAYAYGSSPYVPFKLLTRVLPNPSAANFAGLFYLFTSFLVGYSIARLLSLSPPYSLMFGVLSVPLMFMGLIDAGNMSLVSYGLIALGMLLFYKKDQVLSFVILTFFGSLFLLAGAMYQHYIYMALNFLLLGLLYIDVEKKRKFLLMIGAAGMILFSTALLLNFTLERHLSLLLSSQKSHTMVTFWEMIKMKGYALDPLAWVGYHLPLLHRQIFAFVGGEGGSEFHAIIGSGMFSPGPVYLVLAAIGFMLLFRRHRGYVLLSGFWFLYAVGVVSFLLSVIVGDPFRSESSVRASNLFFLLANVAAVIGLRALIQNLRLLGTRFRIIAALFLGYVLTASIGFLAGNYFLLKSAYPMAETVYIGISAALGIIAMIYVSSKKPWKQQLVSVSLIVGILLVPLGRLALGATPFTFAIHSQAYYLPVTAFEKNLRQQPDIVRTAMMNDSKKGALHEVTPLWFQTPTVSAYFNPIFKEYAEFYQFHRLLFEHPSFSIEEFRRFASTNNAISNNLSAWNVPTSTVTIKNATKKFLELTQTNAIIAPDSIDISNPEWKRRMTANNLSLWVASEAPPAYRFTTNINIIPDKWERLHYVLQDAKWNPMEQTVVEENPGIAMGTHSLPSSLTLNIRKDGYRLFTGDIGETGILSLPVNYDNHWKAFFHTQGGAQTLKILRANYAFLGVLLPPGKGTIEIRYDDELQLRHWIMAIAGLVLLAGIFLFLRRQQKQGFSSPLLFHPVKLLKDIFFTESHQSGLSRDGIQFLRYGLIGVSNVLLDFVIYISLTRGWGFWLSHYLWANFLSFTVVVTWSFFWNKHWTFQERSRQHTAQYVKFLIITVIGLGMYQIILYAGIQFFSLYDLAAKLVAIPLMTAWNFLMHRLWTFRTHVLKSPLRGQEGYVDK